MSSGCLSLNTSALGFGQGRERVPYNFHFFPASINVEINKIANSPTCPPVRESAFPNIGIPDGPGIQDSFLTNAYLFVAYRISTIHGRTNTIMYKNHHRLRMFIARAYTVAFMISKMCKTNLTFVFGENFESHKPRKCQSTIFENI